MAYLQLGMVFDRLCLIFRAAVMAALALPCLAQSGGESFFKAEVEPLLRARCLECHSHAGKIKGGLVLDSRAGWQSGGDSGPAIQPGQVGKSRLIEAVRYGDPHLAMPPKGKLPAAEIAILERWVAMGAPDPRVAAAAPVAAKSGVDIEAGRRHWAYQPVVAPPVPALQKDPWPHNEVDAFLKRRLDQAGLVPAADADAHEWLRRISLDLTGLPPTEEEIADFIADDSAQARAKVIERLLGSRAYGERWARHWLDLVGYAEQIGTEGKVFAEHAWRYRDYLVESFNTDKSYQRLVMEQLAGDLLPASTPRERRANLIATGFLLLGDVDINAIDKLKMEVDFIDAQVSKVGTAFLGMTLGCVRCHDHKFDAIGLQDYYGLAGIMRSSKTTFKTPHGIWSNVQRVALPILPEDEEAGRLHEAQLRPKRDELAALQARLKALPAKAGPQEQKQRDELSSRIAKLELAIAHGEYFHPGRPKAIAVEDAAQPADMRITIRGNPYALGASVPRGLVRVASWEEQPKIAANQSGRLQLAQWIADARHPLTARVAVNRIWQKLFGEGLVRSVDYFGVRGDRPTHPELLDYLAARFMREGWSPKALIRLLVSSRAYAMRSSAALDGRLAKVDADNRLLWRMNAQRLDAESIRDAMLLASGRLVSGQGRPGLPLEFAENVSGLPITAKSNHPQFAIKTERATQAFERTLYLPVVRTGTQPGSARLRDIFDFPQPAQLAGKRSETTVPTQSLYLLNAELIAQRADDVAALLCRGAGFDERVGISRLWLRLFSRPPQPAEVQESLAFLAQVRAEQVRAAKPDEPQAALSELARALMATGEFLRRP
jgi:hypothetical protein